MATLSDSLVSSSARGLALRKRPDLSAKRQQYLGRSYWVVKEPVGLNYYRFQDEEYAILQMLDGHTSLDEIKERFEAEFPPQKITLEELQQFLGMLHRSGLVIAGVGGQGRELKKRRDDRRRKEILGAASNILCIRFKGFDPERFLNWLYPRISWLFSSFAVACYLMMCISAATLVVVEWDIFQSKLPGFYDFFNIHNAIWLAVVLGVTKVFHEFGHGLMCKHFGGECHEMGVMILVLTPCLYCNVSDSWMLPSKWQRAAIGAAGIFVEIILASIATFLWWFSAPETMFNNLLNVMFIASVSTVFFNANPLLRYDGYYILADVAEIPNLRQKATSILTRKLNELCLGLEPPDDPFLPQRNQAFFMFYTIAAVIYRWFILASILYFLFQVFKPYDLEIIGYGIVSMSLFGLIVMPMYKVGKFFYVPGRLDKVKKPGMYASLGILTAVVLAFLFVPLPHSVMCVLEVQPRDAVRVYVDLAEGGRLVEVNVEPGQRVEQGQQIALLKNIDIELEMAQLTGKRDQYLRELESLYRRRPHDPLAASEIPTVESSLETVEKQLAEKQAEQDRLSLIAPVFGVVLPPDSVPEREIEGQLSGWSGTPFERKNLGAQIDEGALFCQVGDPRRLEAMLVIDQTDVVFVRELFREGVQPTVEIKLDNMPHDVIFSRIVSIAEKPLDASPRRLSSKAGGELPTTTDPATGAETTIGTFYPAHAPLGLYGHGEDYTWLRGRLEFMPTTMPVEEVAYDENTEDGTIEAEVTSEPESGGIWSLQYVSADAAPDEFGGRLILADSPELRKFKTGQYVAVSGTLFSGVAEDDSIATNLSALTPAYQVDEIRHLDDANRYVQMGLRGRAKISTKWQSLGQRTWRFITHMFNFKL